MNSGKIEILEIAANPNRRGTVWANVYTRMSGSWMQELIKEGYLTITEDEYGSGPEGFRWSCYYMSPEVGITAKGQEFLRSQMVGVGEW